jgi:hypothetical protein
MTFKEEDPFVLLVESIALGDSSQAIMNQEKRGQNGLINNEVLPKRINTGTKEQFEEMGIVFGEEADDLFVYVTLPDGWKKEPTNHSMWSKLIDDKGRERANIFYKAAVYDRCAFMGITRRYRISSFETTDEQGNLMDDEDATHFSVYILDCKKPIKLIGIRIKEYGSDVVYKQEKEAKNWLDKHYPDYKNPLAYW